MTKAAIAIIKFYRKHLSLLKLQQTCRFYPTCSHYAVQSLEKYGFFKGCLFSIMRVLRCSPLSPGGYDPVK